MATTDNLALVKGILDQMLRSGDADPLLDRLADDVVFSVATLGGRPDRATGKAAVRDYFEPLRELITFWRVSYSWSGERVVVLAEETFTIQPGDLAAHSELTLVFELRDGSIAELVVVETPSPLAASGQIELAGSRVPRRSRQPAWDI